MQQYDPSVPTALKDLQTWFGGIIAQPLNPNGGIAALTPAKKQILEDAKSHILKSPTLEPFQRIEIYNQQYWWRLLKTLHDFFPFLVRLYGYYDFNKMIGIPYLLAHRPVHWSLNGIGTKLPEWIQRNYKKKDKQLAVDAAKLDCAFLAIFFRNKYPPMGPEDAQLEKTLYLQPHVELFSFPYDLFLFRKEMNSQSAEYWCEHPFPKLKKETSYFKLFLSRSSNVVWTKIDKTEYLILEQFKKGATLDTICTWLEEQPEEIRNSAEQSLQNWFKEWTLHGILTTHAG